MEFGTTLWKSLFGHAASDSSRRHSRHTQRLDKRPFSPQGGLFRKRDALKHLAIKPEPQSNHCISRFLFPSRTPEASTPVQASNSRQTRACLRSAPPQRGRLRNNQNDKDKKKPDTYGCTYTVMSIRIYSCMCLSG